MIEAPMHHSIAKDHQSEKVLVAIAILGADHKERDKRCEVALNFQHNANLRAYARILGEVSVIDAKIAGYDELEKAPLISGVMSKMVVVRPDFGARSAVAAELTARSEPKNRSRELG